MDDFRAIPPNGWDAEDTLCIPLDSVAEEGPYVLTLTLRLTASQHYPFSDICLKLTRCLPGDSATAKLRYDLTMGRSEMAGSGVSLYVYDLPVDTLYLKTGTRGHFIIQHDMRLSPLPGLHDVGLSLKRIR